MGGVIDNAFAVADFEFGVMIFRFCQLSNSVNKFHRAHKRRETEVTMNLFAIGSNVPGRIERLH